MNDPCIIFRTLGNYELLPDHFFWEKLSLASAEILIIIFYKLIMIENYKIKNHIRKWWLEFFRQGLNRKPLAVCAINRFTFLTENIAVRLGLWFTLHSWFVFIIIDFMKGLPLITCAAARAVSLGRCRSLRGGKVVTLSATQKWLFFSSRLFFTSVGAVSRRTWFYHVNHMYMRFQRKYELSKPFNIAKLAPSLLMGGI